MGFSSSNQQSGTESNIVDELDSVSSSSEISSVLSSESDHSMDQEVTSSPSTSISPPSGQLGSDPLHDMSSLLQQLPFKRGLSKHFQGKSQSFTSLSDVSCLEDLAKPENPYNKKLKLKSCKSYGGFLDHHISHRSSNNNNNNPPRISNASSRLISKKTSRGSCSSLISAAKRNASFLGNRPPMSPSMRSSTSSSNISNQTPLFA